MPAGRKQATFWFLQWLLKLVVNFFWLPILAVVIYTVYEIIVSHGSGATISNGIVTLLWWLVSWGMLYGVVRIVGLFTGLYRIYSSVANMQKQQDELLRQFGSPFMDMGADMDSMYMNDIDSTMGHTSQRPSGRIIDGTITEIHEDPPQQQPH
jgi:hypothetical protein